MEPRRFKHHDSYFWEFQEAPTTFKLYEIHDINFLKEILNDKSLKISHKDRNKIVNYIASTNTSIPGLRKKAIPTEYIKKPLSGKYRPQYSFQYMEKSLKTKIYNHDGYVSLDIVNRGFTIIHELAKINGINLTCISQLVHNREKVYRDHENFWYDPKCGFLNLIIYPVYLQNQTPFIKNLIHEIHFVSKRIRHPDFPHFSLVNIVEIYTSKILGLIAQYLIVNEIIFEKFYSLNGDEIMFQPRKPFNIKDIEEFIHRQTGFQINLH